MKYTIWVNNWYRMIENRVEESTRCTYHLDGLDLPQDPCAVMLPSHRPPKQLLRTVPAIERLRWVPCAREPVALDHELDVPLQVVWRRGAAQGEELDEEAKRGIERRVLAARGRHDRGEGEDAVGGSNRHDLGYHAAHRGANKVGPGDVEVVEKEEGVGSEGGKGVDRGRGVGVRVGEAQEGGEGDATGTKSEQGG